ncbi:MAG: toll/interleukin-1 receptor domain-containing protein [Xanthobacteraceae bacterium]
MRAFLSYQTDDKIIAGDIKKVLDRLNVETFLAHEDIEVSAEWRLTIIQELMVTDLFIPILSKNYYGSIWCKQESGMAAYRGITIIPLSIDGSIPQGFIAHIQSTRINPKQINAAPLVTGIARRDKAFAIDGIINIISLSGNYRGAEANFELILPYLNDASKEQKVRLLQASLRNNQVCNAGLCATKYLPPLLASHGQYLSAEDRAELTAILDRYKPSF